CSCPTRRTSDLYPGPWPSELHSLSDQFVDHGVDSTRVDDLDALGGHSQGDVAAQRRNVVPLLLNIRVEATLRAALRVGHIVSETGNGPGYLAGCCHVSPPVHKLPTLETSWCGKSLFPDRLRRCRKTSTNSRESHLVERARPRSLSSRTEPTLLRLAAGLTRCASLAVKIVYAKTGLPVRARCLTSAEAVACERWPKLECSGG